MMIEGTMRVASRGRRRWLPRLGALLVLLVIGAAVWQWRAQMAPVPADAAQWVVDQVQRSPGYRSDLASAQMLTGLDCQTGTQLTACDATLLRMLISPPLGVLTRQHPVPWIGWHNGPVHLAIAARVPAAGRHNTSSSAVVPGLTRAYNPTLVASMAVVAAVVLDADARISRQVERESGGYRVTVRQEWGQTPCGYSGPGSSLVCRLLSHPYYWQLVYHVRGSRVSKGALSSNALPH